MKKIITLLAILLSVSIGYGMSVKNMKATDDEMPAFRATKQTFLEFLELRQFPYGNHKDKFDLSSLAQHADGSIYTISDKEKHNHIFKVDWKNSALNKEMEFGIHDKLDIEAIDICGDDFYLSNEKNNKFYIVRKNEKTIAMELDLSLADTRKEILSGNRGFEGMAVDCTNQIMYITKERQPRFILTVDLQAKKAIKKWNIPETDAFDYSDAKFENGFLYLLERTGMMVTKVDPKTEKVIAKYSYQNMEKSYGYLFGPAIYPFAEALMLTPTEIWIGFDNNGLKVTEAAGKDLGIKNRDPLIMRFKRPANF